MSSNPLHSLHPAGTSVWYDNISRSMLENGDLKKLISEFAVRGMTSNPTIFDKAISGSDIYDKDIAQLSKEGLSADKIFESLAVKDIGDAADILKPIYEESDGEDGFVSIEVNPLLARKTEETINEAIRLYERLERPNIMIKIPGTAEGIPAVRACLERGINVNITLLFSVDNYIEVATTYCEALRARVAKGEPVDRIRSVASFFVSRVDSAVDKELDRIASADPSKSERCKELRGAFGIANSRLAYEQFEHIFLGDEFADLRGAGAAVQRPLWASTSVKDPSYRDVMYVEQLIGLHTVNTMPHNTLEAFAGHGEVAQTLTGNYTEDHAVHDGLKELGVDVADILSTLQVDGVAAFSKSFEQLMGTLQEQMSS